MVDLNNNAPTVLMFITYKSQNNNTWFYLDNFNYIFKVPGLVLVIEGPAAESACISALKIQSRCLLMLQYYCSKSIYEPVLCNHVFNSKHFPQYFCSLQEQELRSLMSGSFDSQGHLSCPP